MALIISGYFQIWELLLQNIVAAKYTFCGLVVTSKYIYGGLQLKIRVKSKQTVGNSWNVLKVILGHKYHHNH